MIPMTALTDEAAAKLRPVADDYAWPGIVADISEGRAQLFQLPGRTYCVLRIDHDELVVVALAGRDAVPLFEAALSIARGNNLRAVRFHTQRRGLHRLLGKFGPVDVERIYRVNVA